MSTGDTLFQNIMKNSKKKSKKVISIRVDIETSNKFDKLCKKHKISKASVYTWALEQAIKQMEAQDG